MPVRPIAVVFDAIGTLFPLDPLRERLGLLGVPKTLVKLWIARTLRDAMALEVTGRFLPFLEVASGSLEVLLSEHGVEPNRERVDTVVSGFAELDPAPDALAAMHLLRSANIHVAILTNGSAKTMHQLVERGGLSDSISRIISIEEVRHWKPHREVYLHAGRVLGAAPDVLALVAAHAWDIHGARQAGLTAAWVRGLETHYHPALSQPDISGESLEQVASAIVALK